MMIPADNECDPGLLCKDSAEQDDENGIKYASYCSLAHDTEMIDLVAGLTQQGCCS
jgi:hypothetical protein